MLPEDGTAVDELFASMDELRANDADWRGGRTFSLIYPAGEDVDEVLRRAADLTLFENALNPTKFPSLRRMEQDVISMTAGLLHGDEGATGAMTSGGTESILMAVKSARDRRGIANANIVVPYSAHPAFAKAAHYLGLELRQIPLDDDLRASLPAAAELVDDSTVFLAGSAPGYPHGVIDPIADLAALASDRGIHFHTDACLGGFMLPFLERLGEPVPPFDLRVPGVTTISADVHKYGYCTKGASVIVHRSRDTLRHQAFRFDSWPGGAYGTLSLAGARSAVPIASAWAVMRYLGVSGYTRLAQVVLDTTRRIREGVARAGLRVIGEPAMSVLAIASSNPPTHDIMAVGDVMDDRGWHLDRQREPDALHLMVSPIHAGVVEQFVADLAFAAANAGEARGAEARYA